MKVGTPGFVGSRLAEARQARGLNGTGLAELIGVTPQSVSQYEHGRQSPSPEMLGLIAEKLNMPLSYFMLKQRTDEVNPIFWRGRSTATQAARSRAEIRLIWMREIIDYLTGFSNFRSLICRRSMCHRISVRSIRNFSTMLRRRFASIGG